MSPERRYSGDFGRGSRYDHAWESAIDAFWGAVEKAFKGRVFPGDLSFDEDIHFGAAAGRAILMWLSERHPDPEVREEARIRAKDLR